MSLNAALSAFRARLPKRARLFTGGCSGEPLGLAEAFRAAPELADGVTFVGQWVPGINQTDWAGLHPGAEAETTFLAPVLRASFEHGRTRILPMTYFQSWDWIGQTPLDGGILLVSPPDTDGNVTLGVSVDFGPALVARADVPLLAVINPNMPAPPHTPRVPLSRFAQVTEDTSALLSVAPAPLAPAFADIARHICALVPDGAALQFGIGNVQQAVLTELAGRKGLSIWSGIISDPVIGMLDADPALKVTTGVAVGTEALYRRLAAEPRVRFEPVIVTHNILRLAAIEKFTAINSALEVDLFGQANSEFIRGRQVSGTGGLTDFLRGACASHGGTGITALLSTAGGGALSRIVPRLAPNAVTVSRADMEVVITEHGIARLRGLDLDARANALIAIAAPAHQAALANAWDEMRRGM
ncbi:MAG: acetyl-CoA hydrolase/transferase C-terminal domain-containing protein [Hyphomonas sp.]|uniref:acetyl-CoA hydrolase/transferase family protein n=1 Tax=Hyphomonas sp. TaxID=87 RepID=UPI00349FE336